MKKKVVHLYVFDTMSDWEARYAIAGINNPQFQKNPGSFSVQTVSLNADHIKSIGGINIKPDLALSDLSPEMSSMLILPGGTSWDENKNTEAIELSHKFLKSSIPVAAICGATSGLARGGILDTRRHTSNALEYLKFTGYGGEKFYVDEPSVTDNNVITASGMAPVEFAYSIFKLLEIYNDKTLEAWFGLFKTGKPEYFAALMNSLK